MTKPLKHAVYEYAMPLGFTIWVNGGMGSPGKQVDAREQLRACAETVHAKINDANNRRWFITVPARAESVWVMSTCDIPKAHCRRVSGP